MGARIKTLKLTEAAFQRQVLDLAKACGWRSAHFRPGRTADGWRTAVAGDGKGFPDLVLVRRERLVVAELKIPPNKLTPEQVAWLEAWRRVAMFCGGRIQVETWRPADWDEIVEVLR